jgi:transposase
MGVIKRIEVSVEDRAELERIVRAVSSEVRMVERARIVLGAVEGLKGVEIAARVGCSEPTVVKWRGRYAVKGMDGLRDAPRSGAPLTHGPETRALLIAKACTRPEATAHGARRERWSYEELGAEVGMSASQAHVILSRAEIKPHRSDYWMMSDYSRREFEERLGEVCGLYVDPPENVLVVSLDAKTGIQAKAPTKPDQPPAPGRPAWREHEYTRNGTQCPFACLNVHAGDVLGMASKTRNRWDLIRFLDHLDEEIPVVDGQRSSLSPTTSRPAAPRKSSNGSPTIRAGAFSSHPSTRRGSTRSKSSSRSCGGACSSTASSPARPTSRSRCSRSSRPTTKPPNRSSGPTPARSSKPKSN